MQDYSQPPQLPPMPEWVESDLATAMADIAEALQYPVDSKGRVYDVRYMLPVLAFHLARAGCVVDPDRAVIKKRRLPPTPGVVEDAVEWVSPDAPNSIDDELAGATIEDIPRLSAAARAEFIRRLGGDGTRVEPEPDDVDLDERLGWHVQTSIQFDDEPDSKTPAQVGFLA
ncbi:minor tail protein [Mycobacterium phage Keshu]|uniref:Minor tail protein n=1 Tax=Mycobacterium phage Keshu TaxID=1567471 RepID=A0A0B5A073_9CAUD|nr:minor tail protein [Mycobacterium phage Keshu]AJD82243.1 minor tail protein [Mycobacterium phage Keshu]